MSCFKEELEWAEFAEEGSALDLHSCLYDVRLRIEAMDRERSLLRGDEYIPFTAHRKLILEDFRGTARTEALLFHALNAVAEAYGFVLYRVC